MQALHQHKEVAESASAEGFRFQIFKKSIDDTVSYY